MDTLHFLISLFLFSCFLSLVLPFSPPQTHLPKQCLDDQRAPLLQLQHHLYYAPNFTFSSKFDLWDVNTDCCSWEGVTCDAYGHVVGIDLSYKNLSGSFHSIFDLHRLQHLNLAGNNFNTTVFVWVHISFLSKLILDGNAISYLPPNFLVNSSRLVSLSLSACNLNGQFPTGILLLPKIQSIDISSNDQLMGQLPEFPVNNALLSLSLHDTNFSGKLPHSIGNLKFLTNLELYYCNFFGPIPSSIANLSHLVNFDLSSNKLSGSIHSSLFTLPLLKTLYLGENQLVGKIDEFPNASSSSIERLYIGNNYLTGLIPKSILQLPSLERLYIEGNSFSTMKLDMFVQLNNLRTLWLNNISLLIESDNRSLTFPQLESLRVRSCNLTEFPGFINRQDKLVDLDLSNNHIHGVVPNWLWKSSLSRVDLSFNMIDFPKQLPLNDANFSFPMLTELNLGSCNISAFPEFIKTQDKLVVLDLSNNHIHGVVPNWLWKSSL
ncbi:receptor-like protein 6 [Gossypium hirsutum]|uniref:Receptor-like protein 6 n=1 Tax=Gossypium hirsutum TaxID=3635 RepID=A0ABM2ZNK9_GOSHI|nr:receptor-like protein 6 [Gossypium hirsutum]